MQTTSFENHTPVMSMQLKTENQYLPRRRDGKKCRAILAAVQEWESSLPGRAQDHVAQLVAEQWEKQNGRGISVNKQNLYRYLKNEGGSEKYTSYVIQLSAAIPNRHTCRQSWQSSPRTGNPRGKCSLRFSGSRNLPAA
nr:hypothetical protein [Klebsiella variicola]